MHPVRYLERNFAEKSHESPNVLDLCDDRRDLKEKRYTVEEAKDYRKANGRIQKAAKKAMEGWIDNQCKEFETCLNKTAAREHISW